MKFARTPADVPTALVAAFSYDRKVLLERHVHGRDLAISVLDGPDGPEALPIVEAVPREEDSYDFTARYEIGRTRFECPAQLDDAVAARAREVALEAYGALGCSGFGRVDVMLEEATGDLFVLELNPIPGLTETSLLPQAAEAAGLVFEEPVEQTVPPTLPVAGQE
ncbi:MAG: D-alanine--D-alanine ligase, partial [Solirubrobacteraceae bacterium]